jgi:hypothetical protein
VRSITDAIRHSDCVIVCTDWDEFKSIDWHSMASEMQVFFLSKAPPIYSFFNLMFDVVVQRPAHLFDMRGVCNAAAARAAGLIVYEIGRSEGGVAK